MCSADCFLALLALLFPPLPVWVKRGLCSADSVINLALCMLGGVPGVLHAWYIIFKYPDPFDEYARVPSHGGADTERGGGGAVTWYIVSSQPPASPSAMAAGGLRCAHHHQQQQPNYGTTGPAAAAPNAQDGDGHGAGAGSSAGESSSGAPAVPPTYEQAIKGDHKVQSHE